MKFPHCDNNNYDTSSYLQTLTNVPADLSMVAASEPFASTGFRATHANVLPGSVVTDARVANPQKCVRVANRISIVLTMPNVVPIEPADAVKVLNPREPFV